MFSCKELKEEDLRRLCYKILSKLFEGLSSYVTPYFLVIISKTVIPKEDVCGYKMFVSFFCIYV